MKDHTTASVTRASRLRSIYSFAGETPAPQTAEPHRKSIATSSFLLLRQFLPHQLQQSNSIALSDHCAESFVDTVGIHPFPIGTSAPLTLWANRNAPTPRASPEIPPKPAPPISDPSSPTPHTPSSAKTSGPRQLFTASCQSPHLLLTRCLQVQAVIHPRIRPLRQIDQRRHLHHHLRPAHQIRQMRHAHLLRMNQMQRPRDLGSYP